jgi:hypothetical protein
VPRLGNILILGSLSLFLRNPWIRYVDQKGGLSRDHIDGGCLNLENIVEKYETCHPSSVLTFFQSELFCQCSRWGHTGKKERQEERNYL